MARAISAWRGVFFAATTEPDLSPGAPTPPAPGPGAPELPRFPRDPLNLLLAGRGLICSAGAGRGATSEARV